MASLRGHVAVVENLLANNAQINLQNNVSQLLDHPGDALYVFLWDICRMLLILERERL